MALSLEKSRPIDCSIAPERWPDVPRHGGALLAKRRQLLLQVNDFRDAQQIEYEKEQEPFFSLGCDAVQQAWKVQ